MPSIKCVLYLACLFVVTKAQETDLNSPSSVPQVQQLISVNVGDNVTLQCFYEDKSAGWLFWYKQTLGQEPKPICSFYAYDIKITFYGEFNNNQRFTLETGNNKNHLTISDSEISDSATYYCANSAAFVLSFREAIIVSVTAADMRVRPLVHQSVSGPVHPGGSVTLNCTVHTGTCDGEHSVYWFKDSGESHPGIIYTHGDMNDQCQRKTETQTQTCVYKLSLKRLNRSHAGIYYCAVTSCGQILFGNRTKVDVEYDANLPSSVVFYLSGVLIFTIIMVVFLGLALYKMIKRNQCQCLESTLSAPSRTNAEACQDVDSLHYAALSVSSRSRKQRSTTKTECVYSSVK